MRNTITAAGNSAGATKGNANRKSAAAEMASEEAAKASIAAAASDSDPDHQAAAQAHSEAEAAHEAAMLAQAKAGNTFKAGAHAKKMVEHGAAQELHEKGECPASVQAADSLASEAVHCRASSAAPISASEPWEQDKEVKFMWMPAGVHTINAGFRSGGINLTVEVDPVADTPVVQASLDAQKAEAPKQKPFGCFEHEEKEASVWASRFEPGEDGIYLEAVPSAKGAAEVNGKVRRSWSPSFTTDAQYAKCQCRSCDQGVRACKCSTPSLYFPDGARGSVSNPARITGVDFVVGTLTNKPAFRAISPVRARQQDAVNASKPEGHNQYSDANEAAVEHSSDAKLASTKANSAAGHSAAQDAHEKAALSHSRAGTEAPTIERQKHHESKFDFHAAVAKAHGDFAEHLSGTLAKKTKATSFDATDKVTAAVPDAASDESEEYQDAAKRAALKTKVANETEKTYPDGEHHGEKMNAHYNAKYAHQAAAEKARDPEVKDYHSDMAQDHQEQAGEHGRVCARENLGSEKVTAHQSDELTLNDLQSAVCSEAKSDPRFKSPDDSKSSYCPWCTDVLRDEDEDAWAAVICAPDGKYYRVPFTIDPDDGSVSLGAEATVVTRKTAYVQATEKHFFLFNGSVEFSSAEVIQSKNRPMTVDEILATLVVAKKPEPLSDIEQLVENEKILASLVKQAPAA